MMETGLTTLERLILECEMGSVNDHTIHEAIDEIERLQAELVSSKLRTVDLLAIIRSVDSWLGDDQSYFDSGDFRQAKKELSGEVTIASDELTRLQAENARLHEALLKADVIYDDLDAFMQFDECANDPAQSWPDCDCEGCSYCAASHAMNEYKIATARKRVFFLRVNNMDVNEYISLKYLHVEEAAKRLGIHSESLRRLTRQGHIESAGRVGLKLYYEIAEVNIFASTYRPRNSKNAIAIKVKIAGESEASMYAGQF